MIGPTPFTCRSKVVCPYFFRPSSSILWSYLAMQSFTVSTNCTKGSSASRTSTGIASFTFSCEARTRTPRQSCAHTLHQSSRGVDQLRPHRHQCVPGSQHHQILAHFPTAVPNRIQRLRIHPPQSGQLVRIDAITLPLATLRSFHQPRVGHQHLVPQLGDHVLHPRPSAFLLRSLPAPRVNAWKNSPTSSCVVRNCPSASVSPSKPRMQY